MPFVFDWATLGSANGSSTITDGTKTTVLTATSSPSYFYNGFAGGNLFVNGVTGPRTSTLSFSTPLKTATFEIIDLDSNGTGWDDQVTVLAFDVDGNPVGVVFSNLEAYHTQTGNTVEADGNSSTAVDPPGSPDSITVSFSGPVASIQVVIAPGSDVGRTGVVGISDISGDIVCFAEGTKIATPCGDIDISNLFPGDLVETFDHGAQPLRWIGQRRVTGQGRHAPICISSGTIGNKRDLFVSPMHRVLVSGWQAELLFGEPEVLVPAKHLLGCDGVYQAPRESLTYYHLLFDTHEIIFADGVPCESFHPGVQAMSALQDAQRNEVLSLFPELEGGASSAHETARMSLKAVEGRRLAALI